jgi:hypothetical protein
MKANEVKFGPSFPLCMANDAAPRSALEIGICAAAQMLGIERDHVLTSRIIASGGKSFDDA